MLVKEIDSPRGRRGQIRAALIANKMTNVSLPILGTKQKAINSVQYWAQDNLVVYQADQQIDVRCTPSRFAMKFQRYSVGSLTLFQTPWRGGLFSTDYISVANVTGLVAFRLVLTGDCSCNKKAYQSNAKHLLTNSKTSQ